MARRGLDWTRAACNHPTTFDAAEGTEPC